MRTHVRTVLFSDISPKPSTDIKEHSNLVNEFSVRRDFGLILTQIPNSNSLINSDFIT